MLERVRGQRDSARGPLLPVEQGAPADVHSGGVESGQGVGEGLDVGSFGGECGDGEGFGAVVIVVVVLEGVLGGGGQYGVGAEFEEGFGAGGEVGDGGVEVDGLGDVVAPVVRGGDVLIGG